MRVFQTFSIQRKLILIIMLTSIVALLLAAAIYSTYDLVKLGNSMTRDLRVLASIIGANTRAALVFSDQKSAEDTLATFAAEEHITAAVLYTTSGQPFAQYVRSDLASTFIAPAVQADRTQFESDYLNLFQTIDRQGEHIGTIFLQSDASVFHARLMQYIGIGGLVILAVTLIAFLLSSRLQKIISEPVLHLTQTAWRVSDAQDYSIRAVKTTNDELGFLIDRFNEMLARIQSRDKDLVAANEKLQELDKLKSYFLSNVSHELRTPLTAISSLVDNMLDGVTGAMSQKQTQYLNGVKDSSERLTRLINDLLDLSMIESGKFRLEPSRFSLGDLVHEIATSLGTVAQAKSVALQMPHASGDHLAWADRDRIAQVLNNLIGNAIKFTLAGGKVSVDIISTVENDDSIAVSVSDTGPGIPPEECEQIFDEFYQMSRPGEEKAKGVGLGLAISKKLVEMNNGKISVESNIGSGTTFKFTVPAFREDPTIAEHYRGARI